MFTLLKSVKGLTWMRIGAAVILILLLYLKFYIIVKPTEDISWILLVFAPLIYPFKLSMILQITMITFIVPILVNLALWIPCDSCYMFLRAILYTERLKLVFASIAAIPFIFIVSGMAGGGPNGELLAIGIFATSILFIIFSLYVNVYTLSIMKKEETKTYFNKYNKTEQEIKPILRRFATIFYISILLYSICTK